MLTKIIDQRSDYHQYVSNFNYEIEMEALTLLRNPMIESPQKIKHQKKYRT